MASESDRAYPSQYEGEVLLRDGSKILLRPIRREDAERWLAFVSRLSPDTKYLPLRGMVREIGPDAAARYCAVDYINTFAFVAEVLKERRKEIVAIGRYYRLPNRYSAEADFIVDDAYRGKGIATQLIKWLANVARDSGITTLEGDVPSENEEMMSVLRDYGFHLTSKLKGGIYHVTVPITRTQRVVKMEEGRERLSTIASLRSILSPRSVAVIGASRKQGTIGQIILQCIVQNGFSGTVYPVNPNARTVMSVRAYPSVLDIPDEVDLAVIVVPAWFVSKVADECGQKGVRGIIVISDGFREIGDEGIAREKELRDVALGHGMRLVGPNCMGVINTDPTIKLNASFSLVYPPQGNVGFLSQSGALGLAILNYANNLKMGISTFVSVGNRVDISANDLLQYWEQDPSTRVILLYLESFGNPRKFGRIARRVSATKPIIAAKGGSTIAGSRAATSHTGALVTSEVASDALFRQAGIIRVNTLEELFDVAMLLSSQPIPKGRKVAIVTNGGGPGILASDACEHYGLEVSEFSADAVEALRAIIKRDIRINNPLDLTAGAGAGEFEGVLRVLAEDAGNEAVIAIFIPPIVMDPKNMENAVRRAALSFQRHRKPLLTCFMGEWGFRVKLGSTGKSVPCYPFPEDAALALAKAAEYGQWLKRPEGSIPKIRGIRRGRARKIVEVAMTRSTERPLWLSAEEIAKLLNCYNIRIAEATVAKSAAEAVASALRIGFPVAVKLASSTIVHKTDVGGVVLDLKTKDEVEWAFNGIRARLAEIDRQEEMQGVAVQRMVSEGIEVIVGVTQDPSFGPLIMLGLGGIYAELLKDVAFRLHPLTDMDARELLTSIKMAKLLEGVRGAPPSDTASLEDLLLRLSAMVEDLPQIAELDLNPVKVMPQGEGYWVVDARIMLR